MDGSYEETKTDEVHNAQVTNRAHDAINSMNDTIQRQTEEIHKLGKNLDQMKKIARLEASEAQAMWHIEWVTIPPGVNMTNYEGLSSQSFRVQPGSSGNHWDELIRQGCEGRWEGFHILSHKDAFCGFSMMCVSGDCYPQNWKNEFPGKARDFYNHLSSLPEVKEEEPGKVYVTTLLDIGRHTSANKFAYGH
tara:strand:+ start:188 stop:763 length:576 start_codon:yes stop_codon:yes gene_type:complete